VKLDYKPNFPVTWQRDPRWRDHFLGDIGRGVTIGGAGCAVACLTSWLNWKYKDELDLSAVRWLLHSKRVLIGDDHTLLDWFGIARVWPGGTFDRSCWSRWRTRPADLQRLDYWLKAGPVIVEVDFKPATATVDQYFVVAIGWAESCGALENRCLWVMDPWWGKIVQLPDAYYNGAWDSSPVVQQYGKVARIITGARAVGHAWEVS